MKSRIRNLFLLASVSFALLSCGSSGTAASSNKGAEGVQLSMSNYWRYLDVSINVDTSFNTATTTVDIRGVLSYGFYDQVSAMLRFDAVGRGSPGSGRAYGTFSGSETIELNAAGNFHRTWQDNEIPENMGPGFTYSTFYDFDVTVKLVEIQGSVRFALQ